MERIICGRCKQVDNDEIELLQKHDILYCPKCHSSISLDALSPIPRFIEEWTKNAESIFPILRPPLLMNEFANIRLWNLYQDCYVNILVGRPNASIVIMGVLLEALMKERILLKTGKYFEGAYGECLKIIKSQNLMKTEDIKFLHDFKNKVRNPYQHADEYEILKGIFVRIWPMEFKEEMTLEKIDKFLTDVKSGKLPPKIVPASDYPAIRSIMKQQLDKSIAIFLFNIVYDFLIVANVKYFKPKEYDEHHEKFGSKLQELEHYQI